MGNVRTQQQAAEEFQARGGAIMKAEWLTSSGTAIYAWVKFSLLSCPDKTTTWGQGKARLEKEEGVGGGEVLSASRPSPRPLLRGVFGVITPFGGIIRGRVTV